MKKIIKTLFLLLLVVCMTGCDDSPSSPTVDETEEVALNASKENVQIIFTKKIPSNDVVFLIKNKDETDAKDVTVEVEFWQKNNDGGDDTLIDSVKTHFNCIESDATVAGDASAGKEEYDYYKIFLDIGDANNIQNKEFIKDNILFEDVTNFNPTEKELAEGIEPDTDIRIVLKNKDEERATRVEVAVVFYKDGEIVGYSNSAKQNLDSMTKSTISVSLPIGKNYIEKVEFDSYRIFINQAYKSVYGG